MTPIRPSFLCCSMIFGSLLLAQQAPPAVGDVAPELHVAPIAKDASATPVTLAGLRGKVVVLEFWTTWCGSCLQAAPHWNQVVAEVERTSPGKFAFVAISNESADLVRRCVERVPRAGQIVVDDGDRTFAAYDPGVVPHVVVVGRDGKIAAITRAQALTVKDLQSIAAGKPHAMPLKAPSRRSTSKVKQEPPTERKTRIEKAKVEGRRSMLGDGRFVAEGLPLHVVLRSVYQLPKSQLVVELADREVAYDVTIESPGVSRSQMREYAKAELVRELGVVAKQRTESQDVFVLRRVEGAEPLPPSTAAKRNLTMRGTNLSCRQQSLKPLVQLLSRSAGGRVFLDETGYDGVYDYDLVFFDRDSLVEGLRELGLEYVKQRRDVEVTVLTRAESKSDRR